jgi:hypothetical protein
LYISRFSFSGKKPLLTYEREARIKVESLQQGHAHAIFMWWTLGMDYENEIILRCAPKWALPSSEKVQVNRIFVLLMLYSMT